MRDFIHNRSRYCPFVSLQHMNLALQRMLGRSGMGSDRRNSVSCSNVILLLFNAGGLRLHITVHYYHYYSQVGNR